MMIVFKIIRIILKVILIFKKIMKIKIYLKMNMKMMIQAYNQIVLITLLIIINKLKKNLKSKKNK